MIDTRRLGHVPGLDGLRGLAVLAVLLFHTAALANVFTGQITTIGAFSWVNNVARGSFLGVDMFFVLSGFLITALLLREHDERSTVGLRGFYWRRGARLLPALVIMLAAHYLYVSYVHLPTAREQWSALAALTYTTNYTIVGHSSLVVPGMSHLWSLAVEEQFYLVWPVVLLVLLRWRTSVVPVVLAVAIAAVAINRAVQFHHSPTAFVTAYVRTDTRADSLLVGALLAWAWTRGRTPTRNLKLAAWCGVSVMVVMIATTRTSSAFLYDGGFTLFAVAVAALILAAVETNWGAALRWGPLCKVGLVSYGLYLWHVPIFAAIEHAGHPRWVVARVALGWTLSALATWGSWMLIERHAIAFGRAKSPRPEGRGAVT